MQPLEKKIRYLATIRNKLVHERDFHRIPVRGGGGGEPAVAAAAEPLAVGCHGRPAPREPAAASPPLMCCCCCCLTAASLLLQDRDRFVASFQQAENELKVIISRHGKRPQAAQGGDICAMM